MNLHITAPHIHTPNVVKFLQQALERITTTIVAWSRNYQTRQDLANMDERLLEDIGLTRSDARQEVQKPFWR